MKEVHYSFSLCGILATAFFSFCSADVHAATECINGSCDGLIIESEYKVNDGEVINNTTVGKNGILKVNSGDSAIDVTIDDGGQFLLDTDVTLTNSSQEGK